jgi:hypothetical protein
MDDGTRVYVEVWSPVPASDEEYAGSLGELLGMDKAKCPTCGAWLKDRICLNACHLGEAGKHRFQDHMMDHARQMKFRKATNGDH